MGANQRPRCRIRAPASSRAARRTPARPRRHARGGQDQRSGRARADARARGRRRRPGAGVGARGRTDAEREPLRRLLSGVRASPSGMPSALDARTVSSFFRVYRASVLRRAIARHGDSLIQERGFACKAELLVKLTALGARVDEVPVDLDAARRVGESKMPVLRDDARATGGCSSRERLPSASRVRHDPAVGRRSSAAGSSA